MRCSSNNNCVAHVLSAVPDVTQDKQHKLVPHQERLVAALACATKTPQRLDIAFTIDQHWLPNAAEANTSTSVRAPPNLQRHAAIDVSAGSVTAVIARKPLAAAHSLVDLAELYASPLLDLDAPMRLAPVVVQKAWGNEIWYTGIEARGCSSVTHGAHALPLPELLSLAPDYLCGGRRSLVLMKVLDPHPEALLGDLYFEMHEQKQELYVVTHVDARAWPNGRGAIRIGMNQRLRKAEGDTRLRANYLAATQRYERCRRAIDGLLDTQRTQDGVALNEPVAPSTLQRWLADIPKILRDEEEQLRAAMLRFTQLRTLETGDVVAIPLLTPHALQHGVRVAEFQTPVYERKILSFSQKVLSQAHWDTKAAVAMMRLDAPRSAIELISDSPDARVERIGTFPDFSVQRIRLARGAQAALPTAPYALCLGLEGTTCVGALALTMEQAAFIPASAMHSMLRNQEEQDAVCLLAIPV